MGIQSQRSGYCQVSDRGMARRKGSQSLEGPPAKTSKPSDKSTPVTAEGQIKELEGQIKELYAFIDAKGLTRELPVSLQKHQQAQQGGARSLAKSIRIAINTAYEEIEPETYNAKKSGVTSDDVSQAMVPFIKDIERLRDLPDPEALRLAYDCIIELGHRSYAELDMGGCGYGDRDSDEPADELLVSILMKAKKKGDMLDFGEELRKLERTAEVLEEYGIDTWFVKSIELLRKWAGKTEEVSEDEDDEDSD